MPAGPAAPGRLADATGLPPAYIEVGQLDVFRDEDLRYALALSRADEHQVEHPYGHKLAMLPVLRPRPQANPQVSGLCSVLEPHRSQLPPFEPRYLSPISRGGADRFAPPGVGVTAVARPTGTTSTR